MFTIIGRDVALMTLRHPLRLASFALLALVPSPARASGFDTALFGNDDGQPALGNPYAVYFNPGAMADVRGTVMTGAASIAIHSESYDRPASALSPSDPTLLTNQSYVSANKGHASLLNVLAAPFLGMVTDFGGSSFRLGIAAYAPFGGSVQWDKNQSFAGASADPGAYDGPQRWSSVSTVTTTLAETLAVAYRVEALHLGIGVGVSIMRTSIEDTQGRNFDGSDDTVFSNGTLKEGRAYISVRGVQAGMNAGVWWEPTNGLRLGASYVSQPGFGTMRLKGTFQEQLGGDISVTPPAPADVLQSLPDIIRLGAAWRVMPALDLRVDGTMELWSHFKNQCVVQAGAPCNTSPTGQDLTTGGPILANVVRQGQDSYKVRLGAAYKVNPGTEVHASAALESSSLPTAYEDPLLFDSLRVFGTLGVNQRVAGGLAFGLAYTYVQYLPVTVTDSLLPTYVIPSRSPSADGQYSASVHIFDVAVRYRF
jgi:long-chain fatty acid transport protein